MAEQVSYQGTWELIYVQPARTITIPVDVVQTVGGPDPTFEETTEALIVSYKSGRRRVFPWRAMRLAEFTPPKALR